MAEPQPIPSSIPWPVGATPDVRVAALFPLEASGFDHVYRTRSHALHLHEYAGTIRLGEGARSHGHRFDPREHHFEPGTLTLTPAGIESAYDLPRPGMHWCVHFLGTPAGGRGRRAGPIVRLPIVRPLGPLQAEAMGRFAHVARLHRARANAATGAEVRLLGAAASLACQELLVWAGLLDAGTAAAGHARRRPDDVVDRLVEYVDRHLARPITAATLAAHAGLSQNYLARVFRTRTGATLPRFVLTRRIALARLLLDTTDLPIKQIALRVGLPDAHHFNKQFRAVAGVSPTAHRTAATR